MLMLSIDGTTTVRDMLREYPETFHVLLNRGMCAECQDNPPPVTLEHFAQKHCAGNLGELLTDLRQASTTLLRRNSTTE